MKAHIFKLLRSFFRDGDWDSDDRLIVFVGMTIHEYNGGNAFLEDKVKSEFPDHIWHEDSLSIHRGQLEWHSSFEKLKTEYPELWRVLTFHFQLQEKPDEVRV